MVTELVSDIAAKSLPWPEIKHFKSIGQNRIVLHISVLCKCIADSSLPYKDVELLIVPKFGRSGLVDINLPCSLLE